MTVSMQEAHGYTIGQREKMHTKAPDGQGRGREGTEVRYREHVLQRIYRKEGPSLQHTSIRRNCQQVDTLTLLCESIKALMGLEM